MPLHANCSTYNPLLTLDPANYAPKSAILNKSSTYAFYLWPDSPAINGAYTQCVQQCHGLGDVLCKAIYFGHSVSRQVLSLKDETAGKEVLGKDAEREQATACIMFDKVLGAEDFEIAEEGLWLSPVAAVLRCKE